MYLYGLRQACHRYTQVKYPGRHLIPTYFTTLTRPSCHILIYLYATCPKCHHSKDGMHPRVALAHRRVGDGLMLAAGEMLRAANNCSNPHKYAAGRKKASRAAGQAQSEYGKAKVVLGFCFGKEHPDAKRCEELLAWCTKFYHDAGKGLEGLTSKGEFDE